MINRLRVTEIFFSLQGETRTVGIPTVFVRLTGCPLRCQYCDTAYAFHQGDWWEMDAVLQKISAYPTRYVTITGGEPLAQKAVLVLMQKLCDQGYQVSLETSGALDVSMVDPRVVKVIDVKTPGSGMAAKNDFNHLNYLQPHDQIKFVICDREDFIWAKNIVEQYQLSSRCEVLFSPSYQQQSAGELADWILQEQLPVRMQIQLHKYLWGDVPGR